MQFITNNYSIREVLAFPFLREEKHTKEKFAAELVNVQPLPEEGIRESPSSAVPSNWVANLLFPAHK
jgi:hypothetical protein